MEIKMEDAAVRCMHRADKLKTKGSIINMEIGKFDEKEEKLGI